MAQTILFAILLSWHGFAFTDSPACLQLFQSQERREIQLLHDPSLLRFELPIESVAKADDSLHASWSRKIGKSVYGPLHWRHYLISSNERHQSIYFTKNRKYVISRSSRNVIRVYDSETSTLLSKIRVPELDSNLEQTPQVEIIATSDNLFAVAVETTSRLRSDQDRGLKRYFPDQLYVYRATGDLVTTMSLEQILKRVEISKDETELLVMEADRFYSISLSGDSHQLTSFMLFLDLRDHFHLKDHLVYQTFHVSQDRQFAYLAANTHHGHETRIFSLEYSSLFTSPKFLREWILPLKKIYKIQEGPGVLEVQGLDPISSKTVFITLPR